MIIRKCICGKSFKTKSYLVRKGKGIFCCKRCYYDNAHRPSGLKYILHKVNPTSFKKGQKPWNDGTAGKGICKPNKGSIKKGQRISIKTEFKYKNGNGYRHLLLKGVLKKTCSECEEENIKRLHVHHIDHNRKNNNIDNLIVLCRPCHLLLHNKKERQYVEGRKAVYG